MLRSTIKLLNDQGILIYNFPSHINYTKIAELCVTQCKNYLPDVPIMSVGQPIQGVDLHHNLHIPYTNKKVFGNVSRTWYNLARHLSYKISPWDNTIVIDSDYIIMSTQLKKLFESDQQILMHREWYDITNDKINVMPVGKSQIEMLWATVLKFTKTPHVKEFFNLWEKIILNYNYYAKLLNFSPRVIRNDYAVSIALKQLVNFGSVDHCVIPWSLQTTRENVEIKKITKQKIVLSDNKSNFNLIFDTHILNKESLADAIF